VVDERRHRTLADLAIGIPARVVRMADEDGSFLRYVAELGVTPGAAIHVTGRAPFDGPLEVLVDGCVRAMGTAAAARVFIEETAAPAPRRSPS
jgi:DtxR family Mn-dependent transcriptional regulator